MPSAERSGGAARRVALVTGAGGGGIGTAVARELASQGLTVVVNGLPRHAEALAALADEIGGRPQVFDVGDPRAVAEAVRETRAALGGIDVVVHNAAAGGARLDVTEVDDATWRGELATVLDGAFYLARETAPDMMRRSWGRIVLVSSNVVQRGTRGRNVGYVVAKAGLHGLVRQLALELGSAGVTVNAVAPSQTDTPRVRRGGRRTDESLAAYGRTLPLGRVGRPEDVAAVVAFLAGDAACYVTGAVVPVDGGSSLAPLSSAVTATVPVGDREVR